MNLPIVYQPSVVSDDSMMRFMLLVADIWIKTKPEKHTLTAIDEYWDFWQDKDAMLAIENLIEAGDETVRSMGGIIPAHPRRYRSSNSSTVK